MSGTNAHVVLEHMAEAEQQPAPEGSAVPWVLSGHTPEALRAQAERLADHADAHPGHSTAAIGLALATTRTRHDHRAVLIGDREQMTAGLRALAADAPLATVARGTATVRWTVIGFGRASAGPTQSTPRNLMGFKDGTRNVSTDDEYDRFVWLDDASGWMAGGTYQVVRKIRMNLETWDADVVSDQQRVFGRTKVEGAPLSGGSEHTTPDFHARAPHGTEGGTAIDPRSHVALAAHENNGGVKILRRGYNYTDGLNQYGQLDAGLLFAAYVNDPEHFTRLQRRLGASDRLNEYVSHIGSGVFAVPPAPRKGSYIGEQLFH